MAKELSVFNQMKQGNKQCLDILKNEIGLKTNCFPFAQKLISSLKELDLKTEEDMLHAANVLLSGLQTLMQGGIIAEDYDKLDFVKRGKAIVPSARVEAFYRAAARKGYRITESIVCVPKDDFLTTYFKENFYNGDIIYTLEDRRINPDRTVTAKRLIDKYFAKFLCRLDVHEVSTGKRLAMSVIEMSIDDLLAIASASEQGLYKSKWEVYKDKFGNDKKKKVILDEPNDDSAFWVKWTGEMVYKTVIRRALKRIKEVLPELKESIYAFEQDEYIEESVQDAKNDVIPVEVIYEVPDVDLNALNAEQKADCDEVFELFKANPKLAEDKTNEIISLFEKGEPKNEIINKEYASIFCLKKSKSKWEKLKKYFSEE